MKDKIILAIPCYNCEKQIKRVISSLENNSFYQYFDEILIIDNKSSDGTVAGAVNAVEKTNLSNVRIVENSKNIGLGGTHKVAFRYAIKRNASHLAILHGDDQGDISNLIKIIDGGNHNKYDCCLGSRFSFKSKLVGYSKFRIFGNIIFNTIFTLSSKHIIKDLGAGLNIYKINAIQDNRIFSFSNDLTFNCYMLLFSVSQKHKINFFPITWREDDQISNVKLYSQAKKTFKIAWDFFISGVASLKMANKNISMDELYFIDHNKGNKND